MSHASHLQAFNIYRTFDNTNNNSFQLFPSLPVELRRMIWRASIQRERIIRLSIDPPRNLQVAFKHQVLHTHGSERGSSIRETANLGLFEKISTSEDTLYMLPCIGIQFRAIVQGRNVLSKLLRVSREARNEAKAFYRSRLPCNFTRNNFVNGANEPTSFLDILPFNPEYDFLFVKFRSHPYMVTLAAFLLYIKTSLDPHRVGIRNLALDYRELSNAMLEPWGICTQSERDMITQIFKEFSEVFFITEQPCSTGRYIFPFHSQGALSSNIIFNRSTPILSQSPVFSRLTHDPRPIQHDLHYVYTSEAHPGIITPIWRALLEDLNATGGSTRYSWLLAYKPSNYIESIYSRTDADAFIQRENDELSGQVQGPSISDLIDRAIACGRASPDIRTKLLVSAVPTAFGYWMFHLSLEGDQLYQGQEGDGYTHRLQDLSTFSPALIIADLL